MGRRSFGHPTVPVLYRGRAYRSLPPFGPAARREMQVGHLLLTGRDGWRACCSSMGQVREAGEASLRRPSLPA
jgi:hypothetical protein